MNKDQDLYYILHLRGKNEYGPNRSPWDFMSLPVRDLKRLAKKDEQFNLPSKAEGPVSSEQARSRLASLYMTMYYRDRDPNQFCPNTIEEVLPEIAGDQQGKVSAVYIKLKPGTDINSDEAIIDCIESIGFCNIKKQREQMQNDPAYKEHQRKQQAFKEELDSIPKDQQDSWFQSNRAAFEELENTQKSISNKHMYTEFSGEQIRSALPKVTIPEPTQEKFKEIESLSNDLLQDVNIDDPTKKKCRELMNLLKEYKQSIENIRPNMMSEQDLLTIQRQAANISTKVEDFSKDAAGSPNWLKILGLTLITAGLGLTVIVPLLLLSKTSLRHEHPIAQEARRLNQAGETLINASHHMNENRPNF